MSDLAIPLPPFTENTWSASNPKKASVLFKLPISLSRLLALLDENGEDDYGQIGPSQFAFKTAYLIVFHAIILLGEDLPCAPVVDAEGGVRVTWTRYNKQIKLICPSAKNASVYIYQSSPAGTSLRNQNVTPSVLADRLSWLITRESAAAD
jgi:hypothetical protein